MNSDRYRQRRKLTLKNYIMKTIEIKLYSFNELSQEAKNKAIRQAIEFLDSEPIEHKNENGKIGYEYFEHDESQAEQFIDVNDCLFFKNGTWAQNFKISIL